MIRVGADLQVFVVVQRLKIQLTGDSHSNTHTHTLNGEVSIVLFCYCAICTSEKYIMIHNNDYNHRQLQSNHTHTPACPVCCCAASVQS